MVESIETDDELIGRLRRAMGLEQEVALRRALEGQTAGEYDVLETIGRGARGVVFKARDLKLDRLVAIKCLLGAGGEQRLASAFQEARALATINHPNVAAIYAISEKPQAPFIIMEFVDGVSITEALVGRPVMDQLAAFGQLLRAVTELHRRGLTHRDLKPDNILVDRQGAIKLVDFGIARSIDGFAPSSAEGTPAYLAPEQCHGAPADPAADVFSLGVILFELLTGQRPFAGQTEGQVLRAIREADPPLPRSLREEVPGALQAICLAALEKDARLRYPSAREFLLDLDRFVHGEAVAADPTLLASALDHGIERHVSDIRRWHSDRLISARECDYFLDKYGRLRQREEFWVLDSRRISFSQVMLHLGVWACVVSAFLMLAFSWPRIGVIRPVLPIALMTALLAAGLVLWRRRTHRVAIVLLMGAAIACPIAVGTALAYLGWPRAGAPQDELLSEILSNRQLLAATVAALAVGLLLWSHTRTAAFALITALATVFVATALFSLAGLRRELEEGHLDTVAGWYLAPGLVLLTVAMAVDLRWKVPPFAAPFYVMALMILLTSLTLIARFGPTLRWLGWLGSDAGADMTRQIDYSFMINGGLYLLAGLLADRTAGSAWLRRIGALLFWLAPSHLLIPIWRLEDTWPIFGRSWTFAELLLPCVALLFVFASVPKQMKSFFFSGLFYVAISVQRLTARHFKDELAWPVALAVAGLALALIAWRWPALFDKQRRRGESRQG